MRVADLRGPIAMTLACLLGALGCTEPSRLVVRLRTDLIPGQEFVSTRVTVRAGAASGPLLGDVSSAHPFGSPALDGLLLGDLAIDEANVFLVVQLLDRSGTVVIAQPAFAPLGESQTVTVLITRSCLNIDCGDEDSGLACIDGQCLPAECALGGCAEAACDASAATCEQPIAACAEARCSDGTCFAAAVPGACAAGEWCSPSEGCLRLDGAMSDAGTDADAADDVGPDTSEDVGSDTQPADAGTDSGDTDSGDTGADVEPDSGPACEGVVCDDGNPCTDDSCDPDTGACLVTAGSEGAACSPSDPCAANGECQAGVCAGVGERCDDGLVCTIDSCAPGTGLCTYETDPDCSVPETDALAWCGPGAAPTAPGGTPECPDDKRLEGCPCLTAGEVAPCFTGSRLHRGFGQCTDGMATCIEHPVFGPRWGACVGEVLPSDLSAIGSPESCSCLQEADWQYENGFMGFFMMRFASSDGVNSPSIDPVTFEFRDPLPDFLPSTLSTDCPGEYTLCLTFKAGNNFDPMPGDCTLGEPTCVTQRHPGLGAMRTMDKLPGWRSTNMACANDAWTRGVYGEWRLSLTADHGCAEYTPEPISAVNTRYEAPVCFDMDPTNDEHCRVGGPGGGAGAQF